MRVWMLCFVYVFHIAGSCLYCVVIPYIGNKSFSWIFWTNSFCSKYTNTKYLKIRKIHNTEYSNVWKISDTWPLNRWQLREDIMSILQFFRPKDGLPNPGGSLSRDVPHEAIRAVNIEVAEAITQARKKANKRLGHYYRYAYCYCYSITVFIQ